MVRLIVALSLVAAPAWGDETGELQRALRGLGDGEDLVLFPQQASGGTLRATTRVAATPAAIEAVLTSPTAYREAIPALERAEIVGRRPRGGAGGGAGKGTTAGEDLLVAWELEIPLFNLNGKLWVNARPGQVELLLVEGNLAPGRLLFSWQALDAKTTALTVEARVNVRTGGWVLRRVAGRSSNAEAAITAAATWVALRATAARAEHPSATATSMAARRPHALPSPPPPAALDGASLAAAPLARLRELGGAVALVRRAPSGRLAAAAVAVTVNLPPTVVADKVSTPEQWRSFPGWERVTRLPGRAGAPTVDVDMRDSLPFVDLDTRWRLATRPAVRAQAIDGGTRGALLGWDVFPGGATAKNSIAVLAMYPRLEAAGYVPRKFVAAEPLLEHGLALALTYVNAVSMKAALEAAAAAPATPSQGSQVPAR